MRSMVILVHLDPTLWSPIVFLPLIMKVTIAPTFGSDHIPNAMTLQLGEFKERGDVRRGVLGTICLLLVQ